MKALTLIQACLADETVAVEDSQDLRVLLQEHRLERQFLQWSKRNHIVLPESLQQHLANRCALTQRQSLAKAAATCQIYMALQNSGVRSLCLKGCVLSQLLYGDPAARAFNDIDILVPETQVWEAHECLLSLGYSVQQALRQSQLPYWLHWRKDLTYRHPDTGHYIELHWQLGWHCQRGYLSFEALWQQRQSVLVGHVELTTLSWHDTLIYLAVHGAKHGWRRLFWTMDLVQALTVMPIDIDAAFWQRVDGWDVRRIVQHSLSWANQCSNGRVFQCLQQDQRLNRVAAKVVQLESRAFLYAHADSGSEPLSVSVQRSFMRIIWLHLHLERRLTYYRYRYLYVIGREYFPAWQRHRLPGWGFTIMPWLVPLGGVVSLVRSLAMRCMKGIIGRKYVTIKH